MARLPQPGTDKGTWGNVLNDYLLTSHQADGTIKPAAVSASSLADNIVSQAKLSAGAPTAGQVLSSNGSSLVWATLSGGGSVADATTSSKGIVKLAGDLGGTADAPTVVGLAGKATDTAVVHLTGSETITGTKNFTGTLQSAGNAVVTTTDTRLTDTRTPTAGSVVAASIASDAITEPKLNATNTPANGQLLSYNGANFTWVAAPAGGSDPVMGGDLFGNASSAVVVAGAISTAKLADASITEPKLAVTNSPSTNQVLAWNGSAMAWTTPASGGGGGGGTSAVNQTVYSYEPSTASGLSAIAADGTTDDKATIQAHLNYVSTTYGGGKVILPAGKTIKMSSGLVIPAKVALIGQESTTMNFSTMASNGIAFTINDTNFTPLERLTIIGNNAGNNSSFATTTSVGVSVTGNSLNFRNIALTRFNRGFDFAHDNTFIIDLIDCSAGMCGVCVYVDLNGVNNSGERIVAHGCTWWNSLVIVRAVGSGVGVFFDGCSLDYSGLFAYIADAHVFISNCHLESKLITSSSTDWGTPNNYMMYMNGTGRLYMSNCNIIISGAVYHVVSDLQGPYTYGSGMAHFTNCTSFNTTSGGSSQQGFSEGLYAANSGDTTKTVYSMFVTKWNAMTVSMASTDGYAASPIVPTITAAATDYGTVTVTFSSALTVSPTWFVINY